MSFHTFSCGCRVSEVICFAWLSFILENGWSCILIGEEALVYHTWITIKSIVLLIIWSEWYLFRMWLWLTLWVKYQLVDVLRKVVLMSSMGLVCCEGRLFRTFSVRRLQGVAMHLLLISEFANTIIVSVGMGCYRRLRLWILNLFLTISLRILGMHIHSDVHQQHIVLTLAL